MKKKLIIPLLAFSLAFTSFTALTPVPTYAATEDEEDVEGPYLAEADAVLYLKLTETYELDWYEGDEGEPENVSFTSSDNTIASVDLDGIITANAAGTAKISMFYNKTLIGNCGVRILGENEDPEKIEPIFIDNGQTIKVKMKGAYQLQYDPGTTNAVITFTSSKKKVASVDNDGEVIAKKKKGKTVITMFADGVEIGKCTIKVVKK